MKFYDEYVAMWQQAHWAWVAYKIGVPYAMPVEDPGQLLTEDEYYVVAARDTDLMVAMLHGGTALPVTVEERGSIRGPRGTAFGLKSSDSYDRLSMP